MAGRPDNRDIADVLDRVADLLETQDANPFRVRAWRNGAKAARVADRSLAPLSREDLEALPGIGKSLASAIHEFAHTGRLSMLDRLEGEVSPEDLITTVPGIGEELARRIVRELHVETLEDLELAAHDGRLETVKGFGRRRAQLVREALAGILSRSARRRARRIQWQRAGKAAEEEGGHGRPTVKTILELDAEYRRRAAGGELRMIAPRRFNPGKKAWLPILHAERGGRSFTAMYSNTARAHELGKTRDWVVIYYQSDGRAGQCTVVTAGFGPLRDWRVVRGREPECEAYYARAQKR